MGTIHKVFYASAAAASVALWTLPTSAQVDVDPAPPNLMLLVDTSGSMEYMPDGTKVASCNPNSQSDLNRWGALVSVLTGTVQNRGCYAQDRGSSDFAAEYGLGGDPPYDANYLLPHHRLVSNGCVVGPGAMPASNDLYAWPNGAIAYHSFGDSTQPCATPFDQSSDGLLDVYGERVRFGLMTFDARPEGGTGVSGGMPNFGSGMSGMWSYYNNWQGGGTPVQGSLPGCSTKLLEVGARNAAAPPWEGRMISVGESDLPNETVEGVNGHIQDALLSMRPYGGTPLAAMLADAYVYFRQDSSTHPRDSSHSFGPLLEPMYAGGCRQSFLLVLSDGEPNLDLRPYCEPNNGCPYEKPWEIAGALANSGGANQQVLTFAVGFGLSSGAGIDCNTISMPTDLNSGEICDNPTGALKACCTLSRIAYEGGTPKAYFADDLTTLKNDLQAIIDSVAGGATSRTMPALAGAVSTQANDPNNPAAAVSYEFTTSFKPGLGKLWSGNLERHRWKCETINGALVPVLQPVETNHGDDFAANVNDGQTGNPRKFYSVVADLTNDDRYSEATIRPDLGNDDGLGTYSGSWVTGTASQMSVIMRDNYRAMGMRTMPAVCSESNLLASSSGQCARRVMKWELGLNTAGLPNRGGNEFGAIYHATPEVIGAPRAHIRDPSYELFSQAKATRPLMLYAATTDGQLHAFKVASNDPSDTGVLANALENNELWSFLPPHVLPNIISQHPTSQQILLDGPPVLKDVIFERDLVAAKAGGTSLGADWRTVLVASGRTVDDQNGDFFYALDVTDPASPQFLWQMSYVEQSGQKEAMFGNRAGSPAIAMLSVKDGTDVKEIAVAILPGGEGVALTGTCSRKNATGPWGYIEDATYVPRTNVRCWDDGPSRSVTIVRLEDGEVLKSFRGVAGDGPTLNTGLIKVVDFDSPMTGQPVAYPSQVGQVADRVYVGDADGTLWRIDLSNPDPALWDAHIAFDGYALDGAAEGQPVQGKPVIALDGLGNTVVLFSTGRQDDFHIAVSGMKNQIWSILERPEMVNGVPFTTAVNWGIEFVGGKRVTGPIALFDEVAYFSTFTPQPLGVNACSDGAGSVWGVDFIETTGSSTPEAPVGRLPVDPNAVPIQYVDEEVQPAGTVVFGVAVTQEPACYNTQTVTGDDFVGSTYTSISESTPPTFVLKWHTGQSGTSEGGAATNVESRTLPTPKQTTRIDSWASVVE